MMWENGVVDNDSPTALACCSSVRLAVHGPRYWIPSAGAAYVRSFLITHSMVGFAARVDVSQSYFSPSETGTVPWFESGASFHPAQILF